MNIIYRVNIQVSALPELSKSDFIIDYSLYHYFTATYAYTNTTVDIDSLVEFMQLLPDRHVWAMEGPYTASVSSEYVMRNEE